VREEIERFFRSYRDAYNSGDPAAIARHIAVPSLMLERTATVWSTEAEVLTSMEHLVALYRRSGFKSAAFVVDWLKKQGPDNAAADIVWTIERHDQPSWRFHTGYNLRRIGGTWRIVFCTAYQEPAARQPG
jgi:uncharacterized NTF2-like protein DUF6841